MCCEEWSEAGEQWATHVFQLKAGDPRQQDQLEASYLIQVKHEGGLHGVEMKLEVGGEQQEIFWSSAHKAC